MNQMKRWRKKKKKKEEKGKRRKRKRKERKTKTKKQFHTAISSKYPMSVDTFESRKEFAISK
jgi:hypothetical protein